MDVETANNFHTKVVISKIEKKDLKYIKTVIKSDYTTYKTTEKIKTYGKHFCYADDYIIIALIPPFNLKRIHDDLKYFKVDVISI